MGLGDGVAWGPLCTFLSSFTWAVGSANYSRFAKTHSAFAINFSRALFSLPLFFVATFIISGGISQGFSHFFSLRASHWGWFSLSILASYGLGDALFIWSAQILGVPGALAIGSCYPVWTVLAGYFFLHQTLSVGQLFGLGLTLVGIIIVVLNIPRHETSNAVVNSNTNSGEGLAENTQGQALQRFSLGGCALALGASLAWATNSFAAAQGGADVIPPVANTIRMILALGMSSILSRVFMPRAPMRLPWSQLGRFWWVFLCDAFLGSYLFLYGISHSPLALGTALSSLSPVVSVPVAIFLKLEKFSLYRTLGVICAVFGVCFLLGTF